MTPAAPTVWDQERATIQELAEEFAAQSGVPAETHFTRIVRAILLGKFEDEDHCAVSHPMAGPFRRSDLRYVLLGDATEAEQQTEEELAELTLSEISALHDDRSQGVSFKATYLDRLLIETAAVKRWLNKASNVEQPIADITAGPTADDLEQLARQYISDAERPSQNDFERFARQRGATVIASRAAYKAAMGVTELKTGPIGPRAKQMRRSDKQF